MLKEVLLKILELFLVVERVGGFLSVVVCFKFQSESLSWPFSSI